MSDALRDRINAQWREMRNGDYLRDMVADAKVLLEQNAPEATGTLKRNLTTETPIREDEQGLHAGLGDRSAIGYENIGAPRGTIAAFLRDNPEFRTRSEQRTGGPERAWWDLPGPAKEMLQLERESGMYGGSEQGVGSEKSAYFFPQEGSLDGWGASAAKADIIPMHFVRKAMDEWRATAVADAMANLLNKTGWH